jgi:asparagine synthase (glutamine-hydrolysing)
MFAFAIYDEKTRRLLLARDRLGKKPLHYALKKGQLFFASEIKSILAVVPDLAATDSAGLLQYMYFGYVPDPATAFRSIKKLPPGHLLTYENGEVKLRQYWNLPQYATHSPRSEEECLEQLEHLLSEAVRIRMVADVPLGAMLSGGTDSSTIVALMARASSKPVKTFSIGFQEAQFDEAPFARLVAQTFGTEHHELILEPDVMDTIEELTHFLDEPFGDSSMLPTYYVCCLARKHVTVALSGDGGDELFAGYERYRVHLRDRSYPWLPSWARSLYREKIHAFVPYGVPGRSLAYSISLPWQDRYAEGVSFQPFQREMAPLSEDFVRSGQPLQLLRGYLRDAPASDPLSNVLYLDTKTYLPGDILTKVDRMSMLTSLEARVPLLDHVFLEWVTGLGPQWKWRNGTQKYILRKLAERVGVPKAVLYRRKQGFALPLARWIRRGLRDLVSTVMLEPRTMQRGYFNSAGIRRLLDEHFRERRDHSARIWRLLIFELWHRNFLESFPAVSAKRNHDEASLPRCAG